MEISHTILTDRGMNNKNGCFFCSNMRKDPKGGMMADYKLSALDVRESGETTEWMSQMRKFVQREYNNDINVFSKDDNGDIYIRDELGTNIFRAINYSQTAGWSKGLEVDVNNEVVYAGSQYVGRTVTSKLNGALALGATTIDVIDASGFPSSGYCFIKDDFNGETVLYTGKTANQLTGVTRGEFNTSITAHDDGREIIAFDDDWKDLGSSEIYDFRPMIRVENYTLIGNMDKIAGYKETDGSDFSTNLLDLPTGCKIVDFSTILTGTGIQVLIAVNAGNKGKIFVWKIGESSWDRVIEIEENIKKIHKTLVACASGLYETDGYTLQLIAVLPDDEEEPRSSDFDVYDMVTKENLLLITANCDQFDRNRTGLWILDLIDKNWYYVLPSSYGIYNLDMGAIFISSNWKIFVSHSYNIGAIDLLSTSAQLRGNYYQVIYNPKTSKTLQLKQLKLNIDTKIKQYFNDKNVKFDYIIRYYDFKKPFLQYSQIKEASAINQLILYNTYGKPAVGDRVEVIERSAITEADIAGAPRNITAVSDAGGKYTLTLDENLPAIPTANNQLVLIHSLKKIKKISIDSSEIDFKDFKIAVEDLPEYKKLLLEIEFRVTDGHPGPRLNSIEIISNVLKV